MLLRYAKNSRNLSFRSKQCKQLRCIGVNKTSLARSIWQHKGVFSQKAESKNTKTNKQSYPTTYKPIYFTNNWYKIPQKTVYISCSRRFTTCINSKNGKRTAFQSEIKSSSKINRILSISSWRESVLLRGNFMIFKGDY